MIKEFFIRQGEKRSLSKAKKRLFNKVYQKIAKSKCKVILANSFFEVLSE